MKVYLRLSNQNASAGGKKQRIKGFDKLDCIRNLVQLNLEQTILL